MTIVRTITAAELADGAVETSILGTGATLPEPVLIVELDGANTRVAAAAATRVPTLDKLVIGRCAGPVPAGLASLTAALDLTYAVGPDPTDRAVVGADDIDTALAEFVERVARYPQAALIAGQVVRISETLPVPEAIDIESLAYSTLQGGAEFRGWLEQRRHLDRPLPPPAADPVLIDRDGDILHITLNRPDRRNAYGTALRDALVDALRLPLLDDTIAKIVLAGAGPSFCAGGDLDEFGHAPDTATAHLIRTRGGAGRLVARLADRMEVRLHGHCVGAGIEIPAFAGSVIATPDTVFRLPEVTMGLLPGAGGTVSLPRRIGRWRALHLFVTGSALEARRALEWGLIDEIV
ncbi:enoyl-CoA hydratase/isomerase family protein [Nocardia brevicatena]|uniref:enoyl-CoA hydratase/isomerase family protein n=1 Tax=Nocardia brevicatena TaxID=37327 RepID=UPI00030EE72A|nr:enoyl-CoA hydratase/isomerase family protein [Nocardia brevicatena]